MIMSSRIRQCRQNDIDAVYDIINDAARAYRGHIPADRWKEPYMSREHLQQEIDKGVAFWGCEENGSLIGVMGMQDVQDVTLIRHAYVRTAHRGKGIGGTLLSELKQKTQGPTLVGTWKAAVWAIGFYEKHGYRLVTVEQKDRLLRKYWNIPERQVETSVVLADRTWLASAMGRESNGCTATP
jgi:N-acetylglutamate synthase-like GNAT family acetyltransferase